MNKSQSLLLSGVLNTHSMVILQITYHKEQMMIEMVISSLVIMVMIRADNEQAY